MENRASRTFEPVGRMSRGTFTWLPQWRPPEIRIRFGLAITREERMGPFLETDEDPRQ